MPKLERKRHLYEVPFKSSLLLIWVGFVKKAVIADNIAPYIGEVYQSPELYTAATVMGAAVMFSLQLYCDFSGYSDIAIGSAGLLGYRLPRNFNASHLATNPSEYRRRWHMSLTNWLRDYVFIPLGGTRVGKMKLWRNIMVTNLLSGLWHGAGWTFVFWGAANGIAVILHRQWVAFADSYGLRIPARPFLGFGVTIYFTMITSFFFGADSLNTSLKMFLIAHRLVQAGESTLSFNPFWVVGAIISVQWLYHKLEVVRNVERFPFPLVAVGLGIAFGVSAYFRATEILDFYYFQF